MDPIGRYHGQFRCSGSWVVFPLRINLHWAVLLHGLLPSVINPSHVCYQFLHVGLHVCEWGRSRSDIRRYQMFHGLLLSVINSCKVHFYSQSFMSAVHLRMRAIKEWHSPMPDVTRPASKCHQQLQGSFLLHYPVLHVSCTFADEGDQGVTFTEPRWFGYCIISTGCSGFCKSLSLREGRKILFRFMAIFKTVLFFGCDMWLNTWSKWCSRFIYFKLNNTRDCSCYNMATNLPK